MDQTTTHHLRVLRTARYHAFPPQGAPARRLLIACHGYAQSARTFLDMLQPDMLGHVAVIAPEGLSRFYRRGVEGEVVASWMTREDRQQEINDQIGFLDAVAEQCSAEYGEIPMSVLGFSQGVPTVCRWLARSPWLADRLILWAGMVPEAEYLQDLGGRMNGRVDVVLGERDPFFTPTRESHLSSDLSPWFPHVTWHRYAGGHEVDPLLLREILVDPSIGA